MANPVVNAVGWTLSKGVASKPYKWLENKVNRKTADDIIAYTTIGSVAAKDIVGCGMYVYQSLHNDKIPDKRRKFVAALDLTNGILMVTSQIAMFFAMRKINDKLFPKLFKSFNSEAFPYLARASRVIQRTVLKNPKKVDDKSILRNEHLKMKDIAFSTFKSVTELAAATILAKRVLVPFIATPLASKVEKWMNKGDNDASSDKGAVSQSPSMKGNQLEPKDTVPTEETADDGNTNLIEKYKLSHNA